MKSMPRSVKLFWKRKQGKGSKECVWALEGANDAESRGVTKVKKMKWIS